MRPRASDPFAAAMLLVAAVAAAFVAVPCLALFLSIRLDQLVWALQQEHVLKALWLSLRTSTGAAVICVLLGTPAAYVLARSEFRGKHLLDALLQLPLVIPPVVGGVALLTAFGRRGMLGGVFSMLGLQIPFTTLAVVIAQVFMSLPLFIQASRSGFTLVPQSFEQASMTLGASDLRTFWRITLPLSWPALLSGAILCWGRAIGEFGATIMFAGNLQGVTRTMPLAILTAMQSDVDVAIVLAVLLMVVSGVVFVGARWLLRDVEGRR